jgi:mannosyltransferase
MRICDLIFNCRFDRGMKEKPSTGMGFVQRLAKALPHTAPIPSLDDFKSDKAKPLSTLSFFRRRIRLKGNSSISIPLGFVLLFPTIVVVLILILVIKHPSSPGRILVPAGAPPSIRSVSAYFQDSFH